MEDWQVKLQIESMAIMVEVEAMKADNQMRIHNQCSPAYGESDFDNKADELRGIAHAICSR